MSSVAAPTSYLTPADGYRLWARTYDVEPNPILSLERRVLLPLLPCMNGFDVVDLGCGTGRWLEQARDAGAKSLLGVDLSPEMLSRARAKLGDAASFILADVAGAELASYSADLVICNFVVSYVENPSALVNLVQGILRPGGTLFVTDLHPQTASDFHWRRGCQVDGNNREIRANNRPIDDVIQLFTRVQLETVLRLEPIFGGEERLLFENAGKREYIDQIQAFPAIYILQLSPADDSVRKVHRTAHPGEVNALHGGRVALGSGDALPVNLRMRNSRIQSIGNEKLVRSDNFSSESDLDLRGYLLLPGLINAHDHLEFALFPRLGRGAYANFREWADDIHQSHASLIALHRQVPREVRLWWGGLRNLLSGVTSVCHHNPYEPSVFGPDFAVRILEDVGWAHSLSLDPSFAAKKAATPAGSPFFIHLAEGMDEGSVAEIFELHRAGALDANTTIIHGIGLDAAGRELLRSARAGLIWCPTSNIFLFGMTFSSKDIRDFPKLAIGSDSPLTAQGDLLDELRFAHRELNIPPGDLYACATQQPAHLMRLADGQGNIRVRGMADLIAVRDFGKTPADTLAEMSFRHVELVLLGGRVQLASPDILQRLHPAAREGLQPLTVEETVRWIRAPLDWLFQETKKHLGNEIALGGKPVRRGS
jgi:cytosine/adenosine deaminase-related metal-dependent hydrolase/ubiquinone/menaquinone biosynthesis C-methylase UbiE